MNYVKLVAPAKVNLVLAVGPVRSDGFHQVDTIMHSLALHDVLEMYRYEPLDEGQGLVVQIHNTLDDGVGLDVPTEDNIIYQAITSLANALGRTGDDEIHVNVAKHIPCEAGLGGGSSDAAAALRGAALMWGLDASDERLFSVAQELGSDVAFFLHGGCVYLQGKGDEWAGTLEPQKDFCVLVRPDSGVSTKQAYQAFDQNPVEVTAEYRAQLANFGAASEVELWNNMTAASCSLNADLDALIKQIEALPQVESYVLCGSGSAVCIEAASYDEALALSLVLERAGYWTRLTSFARIGAQVVESA